MKPSSITSISRQLSLFHNPTANLEASGAIFTRPAVANFILDLVGYTANRNIHQQRILEPSFGGGDFLLPIIDRLLTTQRQNSGSCGIQDLANAITAIELDPTIFNQTRQLILDHLLAADIKKSTATHLVDQWLIPGDFLLQNFDQSYDFVVGNPPYVRQELIPEPLLAEYRSRYQTLYDRADLYIPFIENSLLSLTSGGQLGFICADRWMKNRYGGPLRKLIADHFHLKIHVDMVDTPAFQQEVSAYPAITIISHETAKTTRTAHCSSLDTKALQQLAKQLTVDQLPKQSLLVQELQIVTNQTEPWLLASADQTTLIRRIEAQLPTIEKSGCTIGIGVATGADKAFIGDFECLDVEFDRKLPLVTTRDIQSGAVIWSGQGVIDPFAPDGKLVDLQHYPRLQAYLNARKEIIANRYCARKNPANWYRTIDRITPSLAQQPKLLIPDIKGQANIVFEPGKLYPHHNLYYIVTNEWNLRALQAVLLSGIAQLFVATYSTKMRGGYLRFQAQYLRRIRLPHWQDVPKSLRKRLISAAESQNVLACNLAVSELYGLSPSERELLTVNGARK